MSRDGDSASRWSDRVHTTSYAPPLMVRMMQVLSSMVAGLALSGGWLALTVLVPVGCTDYPPPEQLPARYTACAVAGDCVVVELGCCDECNGGEARSVASSQQETVIDQYSESCSSTSGCTEMACGPWETTCDDGVCGMKRGPLAGDTP